MLRAAEPAPMSEINTTPLIDVMLVLLIMFIITIPLQSHAVKIDFPQAPPETIRPDPIKNKIVITEGGAILWNGGAVSMPQLASLLSATRRMTPQPELHLQPEANARYELVDEVLAATKRAGVAHMGFVGNEQYQKF